MWATGCRPQSTPLRLFVGDPRTSLFVNHCTEVFLRSKTGHLLIWSTVSTLGSPQVTEALCLSHHMTCRPEPTELCSRTYRARRAQREAELFTVRIGAALPLGAAGTGRTCRRLPRGPRALSRLGQRPQRIYFIIILPAAPVCSIDFSIYINYLGFQNTNRTPETFHIREESRERREFPHLPEAQAKAWRAGLECPQHRPALSRPSRELSQCSKHGLSARRIRLLKPITEQRPASFKTKNQCLREKRENKEASGTIQGIDLAVRRYRLSVIWGLSRAFHSPGGHGRTTAGRGG